MRLGCLMAAILMLLSFVFIVIYYFKEYSIYYPKGAGFKFLVSSVLSLLFAEIIYIASEMFPITFTIFRFVIRF